ncbi:6-carboxytetrahydropterin synthase QueD [Bordetella sp. FB-8]|uniref:6-carboxytetrahydropterin synthase QueD n=1 Tax=Bordetella sp. FB-8 TaxID=1159870 RepID=UPI00037853A1|nr:6-carboxytetrahydropterin synthase QueD [Bordetella sp. FB-8]
MNHAPASSPVVSVTRKLEFDAGHRIPDHRSQCRNLHGHRYVLEITLAGDIVNAPGASDNGMVMDFTEIKAIAQAHIVQVWDHAFLVYDGDVAVRDFLESLPSHKTVVLDRIPTVENLAAIAFETLAPHYHGHYGNHLRLTRVRLYETPNCWADCEG